MPSHRIVSGKFGLDHVGFTVSNLERAIRFYRMLLQSEPLMKRLYREGYIGKLVGYEDIELDAAFFNLDESGLILELIEYRTPPGGPGGHGNFQRRQCTSMPHCGRSR